MKTNRLIIGSRSSKLALAQVEIVRGKLKAFYPRLQLELKTIKTTGDKILDVALSKIGDKGLFTKEIEEALLRGEIDFAVHSMKDLPTELPPRMKLAVVSEREDACDVLVSKQGYDLKTLPQKAKVGTSSLRRRAQLLHLRSDLQVVDLRGNLDTRIRKLEQGLYDAVILAYAGIKRLNLGLKLNKIPMEEMLPQAGQGALGIEILKDNQQAEKILKVLDDQKNHLCIAGERALLAGLEGGCQVPIGVYASIDNGNITITAGVFSLDGKIAVKDQIGGPKNDARKLGTQLAENILKKKFVRQILEEVKQAGE